MDFKKEKTKDIFLLDTNVENMFINEYMISASGEDVKVYLFALMYANLGVEFSNEDIAKQLSMNIEDVLKAWTYWEKMGVIRKIRKPGDGLLEYDVEFVLLKEMLYGNHENEAVTGVDTGMDAQMTDEGRKEMFSYIEKLLGAPISGSEIVRITAWLEDYQIEPEVVSYAFDYCVSKGKRSLNYIETVVRNWKTQGYGTVEQIKEHLGEQEERNGLYKRVFKALGFRRNWTEEEKRLMNEWFEKMKFTIDDVLTACKKTSGISSPNINYINRILVDWYEKGGRAKASNSMSAGSKMEYYEALRKKEEESAAERRQEVYSKVPEIKEIEDKENKLGKELSKIVVSNRIDKKDAINQLQKTMDSLKTKKAFLLTDNSFELDYMDIRYTCQKCKDTGMLETGERCECFEEITTEKMNQLITN